MLVGRYPRQEAIRYSSERCSYLYNLKLTTSKISSRCFRLGKAPSPQDTRGEEDRSLRIPRALRHRMIHDLNQQLDKRQEAFDRAIDLVRQAIPRRGEGSLVADQKPAYERYLPQVMGLGQSFEQCSPPLQGNIEFADLLFDASFYLREQQMTQEASSMLDLAKKICLQNNSALCPTYITALDLLEPLEHTSDPTRVEEIDAAEAQPHHYETDTSDKQIRRLDTTGVDIQGTETDTLEDGIAASGTTKTDTHNVEPDTLDAGIPALQTNGTQSDNIKPHPLEAEALRTPPDDRKDNNGDMGTYDCQVDVSSGGRSRVECGITQVTEPEAA